MWNAACRLAHRAADMLEVDPCGRAKMLRRWGSMGSAPDSESPESRPVRARLLRGRLISLAVGAVGLYLVWPALLETVGAWPRLSTIKVRWFVGMVLLEASSFACVWLVLAISLRSRRWFLIATSQLASNAASRVIPGGAATGGVVQYRMLTQAGLDVATVATGLTAASVMINAVLFAMPLLTILRSSVAAGRRGARAGDVDRARGVRRPGDRDRLADHIRSTARRDRRRRRPRSELVPPAAWTARDPRSPGPPPPGTRPHAPHARLAMVASAARLGGKWVLDYLALLTALAAVGAHPRPSLVLLAYLSGAILGMVPITPGGLGFVEAGLTTMLVLAGVPAGDASLAVLAYRLVSYWLPLVAGAPATVAYRRRFA